MHPNPSKIGLSVGRILHVYSDRWRGPRPGVVVNADTHPLGACSVNVSLDGESDADVLAACRARPQGNTFAVVVFDPLRSDAEVAAALSAPSVCTHQFADGTKIRVVAAWPPR